MSKRLHVGNLSYSLKSQELEEAFKKIGEVVSVRIMTDRETGQSKGFAFVEMATEDLGAAAMKALDGKEVGGRPLKVTAASPRPERQVGKFGGKREGGFGRNPRNQR